MGLAISSTFSGDGVDSSRRVDANPSSTTPRPLTGDKEDILYRDALQWKALD